MTAVAFSQPDAGWASPPLSGLAAAIATNVVTTVKQAGANAPRSLQRTIGPSEIGTPCVRRLAYKLCDWPEVNNDSDPWASIIGTAVHSWMEETFAAENRRLGQERYVIERRLQIRGNIYGHADLFDRATGTNMDWKCVGLDRLQKYRKDGPGEQYRIQAHLYGLGQENAGEAVNDVAVVFLPRGGRIDGLHVWTERYDRSVALAALDRLDNVMTALTHLDPPENPQAWAMFPASDAFCTYCPWFAPGSTDASRGCPGAGG
ncbi:hypothetical protein [Nonomuraea sp. PA05]|uniref:hypothetical protein n=1 Tax=Nonomuraea sp. PA05 TaxID=2604466 RepID=UPI001CA31D8C|nr:hypothetical protein [Nonomuraea sp. PA05]